jgi:hypothetical protein
MTSRSAHLKAPDADPQYALLALDLDNAEQARELARKIAERSGRTVTVSDADGEVLGVFERAARN